MSTDYRRATHNSGRSPEDHDPSDDGECEVTPGMPNDALRLLRRLKIACTFVFMVMLTPMIFDAFEQLQTGLISQAMGSVMVIAVLSAAFCVAIMSLPSRREH